MAESIIIKFFILLNTTKNGNDIEHRILFHKDVPLKKDSLVNSPKEIIMNQVINIGNFQIYSMTTLKVEANFGEVSI